MKPSMKIGSRLTLLIFLAACTSAPKETQSLSTAPVHTVTATVTQKPSSTPQPIQTHKPSPTATLTPWPTKEVLAQFGNFGGDGGWDYFAFIGGDMPKWILYTDGQFIAENEDNNGVWFEETKLTVPQMCSFLSRIEKAGFFTLAYDNSTSAGIPTANPIYKFNDSTEFYEGGSNYTLQVNGPNPREILVYHSYVPYLIPEAKRIFDLFNNYSPPSRLTAYQPQYLLLRIEKGLGDSVNATPEPITQIWPAQLPSLKLLSNENIETAASGYFSGNSISQVLVKNEEVKPIFDAFGNRLAYQLFQSGDQVYYVAARPFLPHETLHDFSEIPQVKEFALPFTCSN